MRTRRNGGDAGPLDDIGRSSRNKGEATVLRWRALRGRVRLLCNSLIAISFVSAPMNPVVAQMPPVANETTLQRDGARQLRGAEIRERLVGNTQYVWFLKEQGPARKGLVFPMFYKDDRTRRQKSASGTLLEVLWWIDGDLQCVEQKFVNIGHQCYAYWQSGPTLYACLRPEGECSLALSHKSGNPENY